MNNERLTSRAQQAIRTRKKIFDVSIELIRQHGFESVTIENISKKAGVSVGAFYHYFESKSQVIFEIMNRIDEYFEKEVAGKLTGTTFEKITLYFDFYVDYVLLSDLEFIKHLYTTENKLFIKKDRYILTCLGNLIREGQANHEITQDQPVEKIIGTLFTVARGTIFDWCLHDGSYNLKVTVAEHILRILQTYKA